MDDRATPSVLEALPVGRVIARGWIRDQLIRSATGMGGHLDELEPSMIRHPYLDRTTDEGWAEKAKAGWGAEISGNYWYGLVTLAFTLDDAALQEKARLWVDGVLANQRPDGYIGTYTQGDDFFDDYNAWGTACGMSALMAYYDATRRSDVLAAVHRGLLWFCDAWSGDKKTRYAGQYLCTVMSWCFRHTADSRLVTFIREYAEFLDNNDLYLNSQHSMRDPGDLVYNSNHAAGAATLVEVAARGFMATGDPAYLDAGTTLMAKFWRRSLLPTGGVASNSEYLSPRTSVTETEFCAFSFLQRGLGTLGAASGDPAYFDVLETIALNGAQGARKKDERAIAYFSSPNQIFATSTSDFYGRDMGAYAPVHPISCCAATSVWTMPNYLLNMAFTDSSGNGYIAEYGPARIDFGPLTLETISDYPFSSAVSYSATVEAGPQPFALKFRVPAWTSGASLTVNGARVDATPVGGWIQVDRIWTDGDVLIVNLPMHVSLSQMDDRDSWRHYPMVIKYGPLVFSLPIPEVWQPIAGQPRTPLPAGWSWFDVSPEIVEPENVDHYARNGLRKFNISWNVALDERLDPGDVVVNRRETSGYVWEEPRISLTVPAYKALYSYAPYALKTHEVYQSPIDVHENLTVELVPYGCTNLRITCFPRANVLDSGLGQ